MDYISRADFLEGEQNIYCVDCSRRKNSKGRTVYEIGDAPCRACGIGDVLGDIEDFPAADVIERNALQHSQCVESVENALDVPERNVGKWEDKWHSFFKREVPFCSCCQQGSVYKFAFCPNCGAKMEG